MEWVGKIPPTFKGNGFFYMISLSCHSPDHNFLSRFGKNLHQKQRGWCELISVVGSRIVVGTQSHNLLLWSFVESQELFHTFRWRAFSLLKMEPYNSPSTQLMEQALYCTLPSDWLAVVIDSFFIGKVKEILLSRTPKTHWDPNLNKYFVHPNIWVFQLMKPW
jgi:hypothetical protein